MEWGLKNLGPACLATGVVTGWENTAYDQRRGPDSWTPMPASALTGPAERWPKASGNFTTFAMPVNVGQPPRPDAWSAALRLPEMVWNAVVMEDFSRRTVFMEDVRRAGGDTPTGMLVEVLIERKRRLFAADWRLFHVASVDLQGGTMWVRVETRDGRG